MTNRNITQLQDTRRISNIPKLRLALFDGKVHLAWITSQNEYIMCIFTFRLTPPPNKRNSLRQLVTVQYSIHDEERGGLQQVELDYPIGGPRDHTPTPQIR